MNARIVWLGIILTLLGAGILWGTCATQTYAVPLQPPSSTCRPGQFQQVDIAGTYESQFMYVEVGPCGSTLVAWMNDYGEHVVGYLSERRVPTGGVLLAGYIPDEKINAYLDSVPYAALTPAESGWVYLTSISDEGKLIRRYRLMKTS